MIETLIRTLPEDRHAALQAQLVLCSITPSRLYTVFRRNWLSLGQRIHSSSAGHRFEKSSQRLQAVFRFCIVISRMSAIGTKRTSLAVPHLSAFGGRADIDYLLPPSENDEPGGEGFEPWSACPNGPPPCR